MVQCQRDWQAWASAVAKLWDKDFWEELESLLDLECCLASFVGLFAFYFGAEREDSGNTKRKGDGW